MKPASKWITAAGACAVVLGVLHFGAGSASADPAIVLKPAGPCGVPGADANGNIIFGGVTTDSQVVENGNKVTIKCHASGIINLSGRGQHFKGFPCGIVIPSGGFVVTTDSQATVSASGEVTLKCTFTKP